MTMFTEGRLQMYERMMRDTGERSRRDDYDRSRASDQKPAQRSAKKAVAGKKRQVVSMAVFRVEKNRNFTAMSNYHLRDKNLSLNAKGLLSMCLSLTDDWDYRINLR